jgi:hypothetical protein
MRARPSRLADVPATGWSRLGVVVAEVEVVAGRWGEDLDRAVDCLANLRKFLRLFADS